MSFDPTLKGLNTEVTPQSAGQSSLLDVSDMVISQTDKLESRHGINVASLGDVFSTTTATGGKVGVFKIPFSEAFASSSGYKTKYVVLAGTGNNMDELITPGPFSALEIGSIGTIPITYTAKPLGFTFDQSFYIVGATGWQEMQIDTFSSGTAGVKKTILWPPFTDINIDTFQDTQDFSTNWFDINKKVGIRLTYVWNTRYNDETPREVESEPSEIFEVLHPMALRTQDAGSSVGSTSKEKSRIRLRVGQSFTQSIAPFVNYVTSLANGRRFFIRIYRTKQVDISEALPTEYFTAFPDIEIGDSARYSFANDALVSTAADTIDFGATESPRWKNGSLFKYTATSNLIGGLTQNSLYYLGNKSGNTYQVYASSLLTSPINLTAPTGNTAQNIIRVYEANLTVNDDGIQSLPQLYTNPNLDGEPNRNSIPPIAELVVEYKNYHVAANIREPLRAYITLVNQPLVKNLQFTHTTPAGITPYTFNTFDLDVSVPGDLLGIKIGEFGIDSPFFADELPSTIVGLSGNTLVANNNSTLSLTGTRAADTNIKFDGNLVQTNASIRFRFNGGAAITADILPKYNRSSLYSKIGDTNLETLQFSGSLSENGRYYPFSIATPSLLGAHATVAGYTTLVPGTAKGNVTRGFSATSASTGTTGATDLVLPNSNYVEYTGAIADSVVFEEPGFALIQAGASKNTFGYKLFRNIDVNTIRFYGVTNLSVGPISTGAVTYNGFFVKSSSIGATPMYYTNEFLTYGSSIPLVAGGYTIASMTVSLIPLRSYYNSPIAVVGASTITNLGATGPLFLGTLARSPAQLIDECVIDLVQKLNTANINTAVKFVKTDNVGEFYVEYYGGSKIEATILGDYHAYEPKINRSIDAGTLVYTTIAEYKQNNIRAVSVSRYNAPESFPDSQILAPILVGSDKKKIVALAKNSNDCFILKEDGIWRMTISGNTSLPFVEEVQQLDTTTYCQAPYSVQEINEEIIFLSQKGFISISGNSISNIGRNIETEVKSKLQRSIAAGLQNQIRSWVNEEKRIYGCTIAESTVSFTTYVFNTYTREWTKFSLPIIDATTDEQGRTTYVIGRYTTTLGTGTTLQEQLDNSTSGTLSRFLLTEELHTDGQNRNEIDQWDYKYIPLSVSVDGNDAILTDNNALASWCTLGGFGSDITDAGLSLLIGKTLYYRKTNVLYPCTLKSRTLETCTITFAEGVPGSIEFIKGDDGLYAGIPASVTFNPSSVGTPDTNKQFSEYMVHVDEAVSGLSMKFKTDSQALFSASREFAFVTNAPNRTIYRTYIPITACRGRWFIRQVNHSVPYERFVITGQTLKIRDTNSSRVQMARS